MRWTIELSVKAKKELTETPWEQQALIEKALERMEESPFQGNVQSLKDKKWKGVYCRTIGRYRIFFTPLHNERIAYIVSIRLRTEKTYR